MEDWEKEFIQNNLSALLTTTICEKSLIACLIELNILSYTDEAQLDTCANRVDQCFSLYRIIQTRVNAFGGMMEALRRTGQNGALAILQKGLENNRTSDDDVISMSDTEKESPSTIEQKWDKFLENHKIIFFARDASKLAIDDLTHRFYTEEMQHQLKDHKFYSPHVLLVLHHQTADTMIEVYARKAEILKIEHVPIQQILAKSFKQFQSNYTMTLNGNRNFNESAAIGIDLGTCNLCVAVCVQGKMRIFSNPVGEKTTPSYISFGENGKNVIGKTARKNAYKNPHFTIFDSKRMIGRTFDDKTLQEDRKHWPFRINNVDNIPIIVTRENGYIAEEISTLLLAECKAQAEKDLNQSVTKAVITVPAYFNNSQREATERAGKAAGLEVMQILNEPTAAAITYRQERYYDTAKQVLIFDMGGGTFDVAIVKINGEEMATIGIDGDTHLGGEDFDRIIMEYCIQEFERSSGINLREWKSEKDILRNLANLQFQCEEAKKDLSTDDEVTICVPSISVDVDLEVKLDRETFEGLCMPMFNKMLGIVDRLLVCKGVPKGDIEDVILVGGSTRIPKLQQMLRDYFGGKELNTSIHQDHAVAYGAAVQAAILNGEKVKKLLNLQKIVDAIPMSIGIQCIKNGSPGKFSRIIEKDSKYPAKYTQSYVTHKENQDTAVIRVFQGEQENAVDNFFIGMFRFEGIPKKPRGQESFEVCMEIDDMGILKVTASSRGVAGTTELKATLVESSGLQHHLDKRGSSFELERVEF